MVDLAELDFPTLGVAGPSSGSTASNCTSEEATRAMDQRAFDWNPNPLFPNVVKIDALE